MKFYLYVKNNRTNEVEPEVREFANKEDALNWVYEFINGLKVMAEVGNFGKVKIKNIRNDEEDFVAYFANAIRTFLFSDKTIIERIFGDEAPEKLVEKEKQEIEERTRIENEKMERLMDEAAEYERRAEELGVDVLDLMMSEM